MTATMNTSTNGSPRKNLSAQLDRLDSILDGLADGLNEARGNCGPAGRDHRRCSRPFAAS